MTERFNQKYKCTLTCVQKCRATVMDLVQIHCEGDAGWELLRTRLLKAFGSSPNGLEGMITNVFEAH